MGDKDIYIETCHTFGKGFLAPMLQICHDIEIIILHRNPIDVAMSMYRLGDIPGRTKTGIHWYLSPHDYLMTLTYLKRPMELYSDFQLCYWYTQEMLCRMNDVLLHKYMDIKQIEFRELLSYTYFKSVLYRLRLNPIPENYEQYYKSVITSKINEKLYRKHPIPKPPDIDEQVAQVHHDLIVK
jgi:hypothetical protein